MEKVKITREQKEALVQINLNYGRNAFSNFMGGWRETDPNYKVFKDFTPEQFMKLTCNWYEVKKPINIGEWIRDTVSNEYSKAIKFENEKVWLNDDTWIYEDEIEKVYEKVTEPWKIMLLELGREKPEFKIGDLYVDNQGENWRIDDEQFLEEYALPDFENGKIKLFFPVERGIEVKA